MMKGLINMLRHALYSRPSFKDLNQATDGERVMVERANLKRERENQTALARMASVEFLNSLSRNVLDDVRGDRK